MNPNSAYHLSFDLGFPNAYDRAHGATGAYLMVHGVCSSAGCYAMTDAQIEEIYAIAREAFAGGQEAFQVQAFPFRMTPQNMARRRGDENYEFWRMLKEGYDHFEVTHLPPKVAVCSKRYVFNAEPVAGVTFNPTGECPEMSVPDPIRTAVAEKAAKDAAREVIIAQKVGTGGEAAPATPSPEAYETMLAEGAAAGAQSVPAAAVVAADAPSSGPAEAAPDPAVATAYAPSEEEEGGFFSRLVKKVW
jgi:murein L,D-transpeptidase YafK